MATYYRPRAPGARLLELLRGAHDDGQLELSVVYDAPALIVLHLDSSEITQAEDLEVRALLAADDAEPFGDGDTE